MNDPQVWTLIGVFAAIMLGGMTLMTTLITRATTNAISSVRSEVTSLRNEMNAANTSLRNEMNARFDAVYAKIEHLDRDVNLLMRRAWGEPSPE